MKKILANLILITFLVVLFAPMTVSAALYGPFLVDPVLEGPIKVERGKSFEITITVIAKEAGLYSCSIESSMSNDTHSTGCTIDSIIADTGFCTCKWVFVAPEDEEKELSWVYFNNARVKDSGGGGVIADISAVPSNLNLPLVDESGESGEEGTGGGTGGGISGGILSCCELGRDIKVSGITYKKGQWFGEAGCIKGDEEKVSDTECVVGEDNTVSVGCATDKWGMICLLNTLYGIVDWVFVALIAVAGILIIIGAFNLVTSSGNPEKVTSGRNYILYAAIGIAVGFLARAIPAIVQMIVGV